MVKKTCSHWKTWTCRNFIKSRSPSMEEMEGMRERESERWEGMEEVRRNGGEDVKGMIQGIEGKEKERPCIFVQKYRTLVGKNRTTFSKWVIVSYFSFNSKKFLENFPCRFVFHYLSNSIFLTEFRNFFNLKFYNSNFYVFFLKNNSLGINEFYVFLSKICCLYFFKTVFFTTEKMYYWNYY